MVVQIHSVCLSVIIEGIVISNSATAIFKNQIILLSVFQDFFKYGLCAHVLGVNPVHQSDAIHLTECDG